MAVALLARSAAEEQWSIASRLGRGRLDRHREIVAQTSISIATLPYVLQCPRWSSLLPRSVVVFACWGGSVCSPSHQETAFAAFASTLFFPLHGTVTLSTPCAHVRMSFNVLWPARAFYNCHCLYSSLSGNHPHCILKNLHYLSAPIIVKWALRAATPEICNTHRPHCGGRQQKHE